MKIENYILLVLVLSSFGHARSSLFDTAINWVNSVTDSASSYWCSMYECCNIKQVPYNIRSLKTMFNTKLYGQHLAKEVVLTAINSHVRKSKSRKPLVMSFHGPPGVGKSYVSKMIARAFYEKGDNSRYFHFYYGLENFPLIEKTSEYQAKLKSDIESAVASCEKSLFVFDGVDFMPPGLLNVLMTFIDCPRCSNKLNKNKSIFIFLTNTGSTAIEKLLLQKLRNGETRKSCVLKDFEKIIISESVELKGGLYDSLMITSDAIDFYVPFLPMEKGDVELCVIEALTELNLQPTIKLIDEVVQELRFGPEPDNLFSKSGCKRVEQIAGRIAARLNPDFNEFEEMMNGKDEF